MNFTILVKGLFMFAADALCDMGAIDTLLSNFIIPLQGTEVASHSDDPSSHRVHCSLNINTETGRLSCRRPNLQNQPALEKDRYKVTICSYLLSHLISFIFVWVLPNVGVIGNLSERWGGLIAIKNCWFVALQARYNDDKERYCESKWIR